jgi:hypothetical protein
LTQRQQIARLIAANTPHLEIIQPKELEASVPKIHNKDRHHTACYTSSSVRHILVSAILVREQLDNVHGTSETMSD